MYSRCVFHCYISGLWCRGHLSDTKGRLFEQEEHNGREVVDTSRHRNTKYVSIVHRYNQYEEFYLLVDITERIDRYIPAVM